MIQTFKIKKTEMKTKDLNREKKKISIKLEAEWIIQILIFVVNPLLVLRALYSLVIVSRGQKGNSAPYSQISQSAGRTDGHLGGILVKLTSLEHIALCVEESSQKGKSARFKLKRTKIQRYNEGYLWNQIVHMLGIINQTSTKMPANMFSEVNANQIQEDHRALQIAFELSVLRMNGDDEVPNLASSTMDSETARKRSANMTECVPVPSSEHVAEIVGRQGKL